MYAVVSHFSMANLANWSNKWRNNSVISSSTGIVLQALHLALQALSAKILFVTELLCGVLGCWKSGILGFVWISNSTTEHDAMKLITPFHSEPTTHSNNITVSSYEKNTQNWWKSPYYRLGVSSKFGHFCNMFKTLKQFTYQIISWAEQNSTNNYVIASTVAKIFWHNWGTCACLQNPMWLDLKTTTSTCVPEKPLKM